MSEKILKVRGSDIQITKKEYISLTDIAKYRNQKHPDDIIKNWLRNKNTIEYLGLWEKINNEYFKPVEFDRFKTEAGNNSFVLRPNLWITKTDIKQLICLSNLESINAELIREGIEQKGRLKKLNGIAIIQMKSLLTTKNISE